MFQKKPLFFPSWRHSSSCFYYSVNLPSSWHAPQSLWARPRWGTHLYARAGKGLMDRKEMSDGRRIRCGRTSLWWKSRVRVTSEEFKRDEISVCELSLWTGSLKSFKHMRTSGSLPINSGTVAGCGGARTGLVVEGEAKIIASHTLWNQQVLKRIHRRAGRTLPADRVDFFFHDYCKNTISSTFFFADT